MQIFHSKGREELFDIVYKYLKDIQSQITQLSNLLFKNPF